MKKMKKLILSLVFFALLFFLLHYATGLVRPVWSDWNNYNTVHDFYNEPKNRIEVAFLGTSVIVNGVSPVQLYEEEGICAYNLGTAKQPLQASFSLLKELYRLQSQSIKVIVLDVGMLTRTTETDAFYHRAIEHTKLSLVKLQSLGAYSSSFTEWINYSIPLFHYHSRWTELSNYDWRKWKNSNDTRGYNITGYKWVLYESDAASILEYNKGFITAKQEIPEETLYWFDRIVSFCKENGLQLVLTKTPVVSWSAEEHNAVCELSRKFNLEYIDFNCSPFYEQLNLNCLLDSMDGTHLNYYGARKFTHWWAEYLRNNTSCNDVRNDVDYQYLFEQNKRYNDSISQFVKLNDCDDFVDYISYAMKIPHTVVAISVCDDAANAITDEQRILLSDLGLVKLSNISFRDSYVGIIVDNVIIDEKGQADEGTTIEKTGYSLESAIILENSDAVFVASSGYGHRETTAASIRINQSEQSINHRGINIVVYDYNRREIIDSSFFDTYESSKRDCTPEISLIGAINERKHISETGGVLRRLLIYERKNYNYINSSSWNESNNMELFSWVYPWIDRYGYIVFISVLDEGSYKLTSEDRYMLNKMGLAELSQLSFRDSYIGIIDDGCVAYEERDHGSQPIKYSNFGFGEIVSGGADSGNECKIEIHGKDYAIGGRGIHFVIYDKELSTVVNQGTFDTYQYPIEHVNKTDLLILEGNKNAVH